MSANLLLFEDHHSENMYPITLTRPAFAVTCAAYRLWDIAAMASDNVRYIVRDWIEDVTKRNHPHAPPAAGPTLFLNASVAPDVRYIERIRKILAAGEPFMCTSGQRVAAALLPADAEIPADLSPADVTSFLLDKRLPLREAEFQTFDYPFHVVGALYDLFEANIARKIADRNYTEIQDGVFTGEGVTIAKNAVFHTDEGPIVLEDGVKVMDFTYLCGPIYIGPKSRVIERSSVKDFASIGHTCKIGGEVEACVIESYTNKQHHGFLGHAYVGSWVNLGAGTSNSDLKNTYGKVRIVHRGHRMDTDMQFFGCIIGDFSKSAINTSIFTGKIIGVNSMLYGYIGQNVASFCNFAKSFGQITECPVEMAAGTQKRMFARRDVTQTEADIALLQTVFDLTRDDRAISTALPVL